MDRIVSSLVADLLAQQELTTCGQDKDFEIFCNFCIISKEYNKEFDLLTSLTGYGDDTGIDGIAIIVNGQLIENVEEIDFLLESSSILEATYLYIQAKTSNDFSSSEMNNFSYGVKDFFSERPRLRRNAEIQSFVQISNYLLSKASKFRENPKCKLFYITNGIWNGDQNNVAIIDSTIADLRATNLFSQVSYDALGANEISKFYRDSKNSVTTTFVFQEKITLPDLPSISESYFGIIPLEEFKKILVDDNGNLRNVFYDNVRDFQGYDNPVNNGVMNTLNGDNPELFTVLNNGITVVADSLRNSGNRFTIFDYQIVNGCQTSNILYNFIKETSLNTVNIPIKLVITNDDEIKNKITIATNSQTAIRREQLQAMTDFQKNLEYYFQSIPGDGILFYERRSGQYQSDGNVIKSRIINMQNLIKSFSSMFYENPDRVTTYFGTIVKQNVGIENPTIFNSGHRHILYYYSALAYYKLESLFRSQLIDSNYRKIKFFLLMLFRMRLNERVLPKTQMTSERACSEYCNPLIEILNNSEKTLIAFKDTIEIVKLSGLNVNDKQLIKQVTFTNQLKEAFNVYNDLK